MASSKVVEAVKDILTCSICLEEAVDPRALTCQHTYCFKCLKMYSSTDENKKNLENKKEIPCPTCRYQCKVPNGKVEALPTSFIFSQLKDATGQASLQKHVKRRSTVSMCSSSECADEVAVFYCKTCHYVCHACAGDHRTVRILKKHDLISLDEAAEMIRDSLPVCLEHPEQTLQLYCEPCKLPVCFLCHALKHAQHSCVTMKNKVSKAKEELNIILDKAVSIIKESEKAYETINCQLAKQEEYFKSTIQEASTAADVIYVDVKTKETQIKNEIEGIWKSQRDISERENEKITNLNKTLSQILKCERDLREFGSPCDYVNRVPSLKIQLADINNDIAHSLDEIDSLTDVRRMISDMKYILDTKEKFRQQKEVVNNQTKDIIDLKEKCRQHQEVASNKTKELQKKLEDAKHKLSGYQTESNYLTAGLQEFKKKNAMKHKEICQLREELKREKGENIVSKKKIGQLDIELHKQKGENMASKTEQDKLREEAQKQHDLNAKAKEKMSQLGTELDKQKTDNTASRTLIHGLKTDLKRNKEDISNFKKEQDKLCGEAKRQQNLNGKTNAALQEEKRKNTASKKEQDKLHKEAKALQDLNVRSKEIMCHLERELQTQKDENTAFRRKMYQLDRELEKQNSENTASKKKQEKLHKEAQTQHDLNARAKEEIKNATKRAEATDTSFIWMTLILLVIYLCFFSPSSVFLLWIELTITSVIIGVCIYQFEYLPQPVDGTWSTSVGVNGYTVVKCTFPDGIQKGAHARPGEVYKGSTLSLTIPNTIGGLEALNLMERAFIAKVLVTVKDDIICWNDKLSFRSGSVVDDLNTILNHFS